MTMIQRRNRNSGPALGHDSFLDVVANLVAIVIILVAVVGSHSKQVIAAAKLEQEQSAVASVTPVGENDVSEDKVNEKLKVLQAETNRAVSAFKESQRLEAAIKESDQVIDAMARERGKMIDLLEVVKIAWAEKQKELDQTKVQQAVSLSAQTVAEKELKDLQATRLRLENTPEPVVAVAHLPTPMAKTVFGEELHFRLKDGRLSVVPIDRLIEEIKRDFQRSVAGSRDGVLESAVGPLQGYVAKYEMNKSREMVSQGGQVSSATRIELVGMTIEPLKEPHGQPLESIIAGEGSQLDIELAGRNPDRTTITVWVYPESFGDYRRLKEHLYSRGYATAARPLPTGLPISGGPQGSRSKAQ